MRFEFNAVVKRMIEEDVSIIVDAEDEVQAEEQAMELISEGPTEIRAIRYLVERRRRNEPDEVELNLVVYEPGPRYA